jgi:hypothetical protein
VHFPKAVVHRLYIHLDRLSPFGAAQRRVTIDIGDEGGVDLNPGIEKAMMSRRCAAAEETEYQISGSRNDYRLYVDELFDAIGRELATVTAFLDPAERQSGVRSYSIVDEDAAALNHLGSDTLAAG